MNSYRDGEDSALYINAMNGNIDGVVSAVESGEDVNVVSIYSGYSALMVACINGHRGVAEWLINNGADASFRAGNGRSLIITSCKNMDAGFLSILIDCGADVNDMDATGWSPLHEAARFGRVDLLDFLVGRGADFGRKAMIGYPINYALEFGHIDAAKRLVELGASIDHLKGILDKQYKILSAHKEGYLIKSALTRVADDKKQIPVSSFGL